MSWKNLDAQLAHPQRTKERLQEAIELTADVGGAAWLLGIPPQTFIRLCWLNNIRSEPSARTP